MAYIYRYHVKNKKIRESSDLTEYKPDILKVLEIHFGNNLKDSRVQKYYFEFKLYSSVDNAKLQHMGRKLAQVFTRHFRDSNTYQGFVRMPQTLYLFLYADGDYKYIELLDCKDIDELVGIDTHEREPFHMRAQEYLRKVSSSGENNNVGFTENQSHNLANIIYLDTIGIYFDSDIVNTFKSFRNNQTDQDILLRITGWHIKNPSDKQKENLKLMEIDNSFNEEIVRLRDDINTEGMHNNGNNIEVDYISIHERDIHWVGDQNEKLKHIHQELNPEPFIGTADRIDALENLTNKNLVFTVHNVGQGLSTSLRHTDEKTSFLFFDFGTGVRQNAKTRPACMSGSISQNSSIVLSHIDEDHWYRLMINRDAFKCKWYVPSHIWQANKLLSRRCGEIILSNGCIEKVEKTIHFRGGALYCHAKSKANPARKATTIHETGLGLRLEGVDESGNRLNILIPGDQEYDYIDNIHLSDIDIIVASHHGGEYSWSKTRNDIPAPGNNVSSLVVYSYGKDNTYGHPSKIQDYKEKGWADQHNTTEGDLTEIFRL